MKVAPLHWLYRKLGRRYTRVGLFAVFQITHVVVLVGVSLLWLYIDISGRELLKAIVVSQVIAAITNILTLRVGFRLLRPADPWLRGDRSAESALRAWQALACLPLNVVRARSIAMLMLAVVPMSLFLTADLGYALFPSFLIFIAGAAVVVAYGVLAVFFSSELLMRPVLEELSADLPVDGDLGVTTVGARSRLLIALPVINIITGVVVAGLASDHGGVRALGFGVLAATAVALTITLELTVLLARSLFDPLVELQRATDRVADGDFDVRVPVLGSDEAGRLSASFNQMVEGLREREALHEAFGAFVDPIVADRVLEEGTVLEGEEVEVTILFLDIRGFTAFAETATAAEVVNVLNRFFDRVVPIIDRHGGHANKFIGDGLLGVFGAPDRLEDHADRAVQAALDIAAMVRASYGDELRIGIGVNTGPVVAGTIGGGGRVEFTVIGDAVNTASRVEAVTRETGDDVLVTEATRLRMRRDVGGFEERGAVELRGKAEKVRVLAPVAARPAASGAVSRR